MREQIKIGLSFLTAAQNRQFRVIFGQGNVAASSDYVVDMMPEARLESALATVRKALIGAKIKVEGVNT